MKKRWLVVLIVFIFCFINVQALEIDCQSDSFLVNESLECNLNLNNNSDLKNISFDVQANLDTLIKSNNYLVSQNGNHVTIDFQDNYSQNTIGSITFKANTNTIIGNNNIVLSNIVLVDSEDNEVEINDVEKTITVNENNKSGDAFLTKIIVDGVELSDFSPNKFQYKNIYVNKQIVFIDAERHSDKASVNGLGNVLVRTNQTVTRIIKVTAENGDVIEYSLEITNGSNPNNDVNADIVNSDNRIKNLALYYKNEQIKLNFDSGKTVYNVVMPRSDMDQITVEATLSDAKASFVKDYGPKTYALSYGDNKIELKVKAENESVLTYKINVTRNDDRSTDNSLKSLKINNKEIQLENGTLEYFISLTHEETRTKIEAVPNDDKADVIYQNISLIDGENSPLTIKVVAENGNAKEYKIKIIRLKEEESKILLESIKIKGYDFPFVLDSYVYYLDVDKDTEKLDIVVSPASIYHEIEGNGDLQNKSIVRVNVTDSDGYRTYIINIIKPVTDEFMILYYFVFGIGVITFIASIIYAINVNKMKKR